MTMVLTAMTDNHIFVVSDRRMTDGRTHRTLSSTENKAVVLDNQMILTYTGFCNLEDLPTDAWVAEVLVNEPVENWIRILLNRVGPAVRKIKVDPRKRRHAFLLTGYAKMPKGRHAYRPVGFLISNFHGPDGSILSQPEPKFWLSLLRLGNWKVRVDSIRGEVDLSNHRRVVLEKAIRRQLRATPDRPQRVLDILGEEVRNVARKDASVGPDLMAVSFPLTAIGSGLHMAIDPTAVDWRTELITFYADINSTPVSYGPTYVRPGMQMIGMVVSHSIDSSQPSHRIFANFRQKGTSPN